MIPYHDKKHFLSWVVFAFIYLHIVSCQSGNEGIGLGVFHFQPSENLELDIYESVESLEPLLTVSVTFRNDSMSSSVFNSSEEEHLTFNPLYYNANLATLSLRVIFCKGAWCKVVLNEQLLSYGWIKLYASQIETWETFLQSIHHISPRNGELRKARYSKELMPYSPSYHCLRMKESIFDWLMVQHLPEFCFEKNLSHKGPGGFVKWKENNKLLIDFRM